MPDAFFERVALYYPNKGSPFSINGSLISSFEPSYIEDGGAV